MSFAQLQIGSENASSIPVSAVCNAKELTPVKTTGDLLAILQKNPTRALKMLKTVCGHLGKYLDLPGDQIPFDLIEARKCGFRPFLESRRYSENSIRSYVYQQRSLLKMAMRRGWDPDGDPNEAWKPLFEFAVKERLTDIIRHFARTLASPAAVTKDAVDAWGKARLVDGLMYTSIAAKKNAFWRLLKKTGWVTTTPGHLLKFELYGLPLDEMPAKLREDIRAVLKWKQAAFAPNRPKYGKIRAVTANNVRLILQQLSGYVIKVRGGSPRSLSELIQPENISGFVEWAMDERNIKGRSIEGRLASVLAIVKYHPLFKGRDYRWFKTLIDEIPVEDPS